MPYALRYMIDTEMKGMQWLRMKAGCYKIRDPKAQWTRSQIEIDIENYNTVEPLPFEGAYSKIAPLRIMSFDIECSAEKGRFP